MRDARFDATMSMFTGMFTGSGGGDGTPMIDAIAETITIRDAEWQARVDAARREGWSAGVRAGWFADKAVTFGDRVAELEALIAQGPK